MKKLLKLSYLAVAAALTLFTACKQEALNPTDTSSVSDTKTLELKGVSMKEGALHFADAESFNKALNVLNKADVSQYKSFCEEKGFKSLEMIEHEALERLETLRTKEEFALFKKENEDIFSFENEEITLKVYSKLTPRLLDRKGLLRIKNDIYAYDDKGVIIALNNDISALENAKTSRRSVKGSVIVTDKSQLLNIRAACGVAPNTGWISGANWRRGILGCGTEFTKTLVQGGTIFADIYDVNFLSFSEGRAQKYNTWFGYWTDVSTNHTMVVNMQATAWTDGSKTNSIAKDFQLTFSSNNITKIKFIENLMRWPLTAIANPQVFFYVNGQNQYFRDFNRINNTYTNAVSVNASINCN